MRVGQAEEVSSYQGPELSFDTAAATDVVATDPMAERAKLFKLASLEQPVAEAPAAAAPAKAAAPVKKMPSELTFSHGTNVTDEMGYVEGFEGNLLKLSTNGKRVLSSRDLNGNSFRQAFIKQYGNTAYRAYVKPLREALLAERLKANALYAAGVREVPVEKSPVMTAVIETITADQFVDLTAEAAQEAKKAKPVVRTINTQGYAFSATGVTKKTTAAAPAKTNEAKQPTATPRKLGAAMPAVDVAAARPLPTLKTDAKLFAAAPELKTIDAVETLGDFARKTIARGTASDLDKAQKIGRGSNASAGEPRFDNAKVVGERATKAGLSILLIAAVVGGAMALKRRLFSPALRGRDEAADNAVYEAQQTGNTVIVEAPAVPVAANEDVLELTPEAFPIVEKAAPQAQAARRRKRRRYGHYAMAAASLGSAFSVHQGIATTQPSRPAGIATMNAHNLFI